MEPNTTQTIPPFSPTIANVAAALAAAQGEFEAAGKDRTAKVNSDKGNYTYTYANFASIMGAVRAPLAKHKLAVTCRVRTDAQGATAVAILLHASGEWMCGEPVTIKSNAGTPQATGSAIEYARKYAVRTLLNIATDEEDDDGQAAAQNGAQTSAQGQRSAPRQAAAKEAKAKEQPKPDAPKSDESAASKVIAARTKQLWNRAKEEGVTADEWSKWAENVLQAKKTQAELTENDVDQLAACLSELLATKVTKPEDAKAAGF